VGTRIIEDEFPSLRGNRGRRGKREREREKEEGERGNRLLMEAAPDVIFLLGGDAINF